MIINNKNIKRFQVMTVEGKAYLTDVKYFLELTSEPLTEQRLEALSSELKALYCKQSRMQFSKGTLKATSVKIDTVDWLLHQSTVMTKETLNV